MRMTDRVNERAASEREIWRVRKGAREEVKWQDKNFRESMKKTRKLTWKKCSSSHVLSVQMLSRP